MKIKSKSRISLVSVIIIIVVVIILIVLVSWITSPKDTVTTDAEGNKTIETAQEAPKTDLKDVTPEVQEKFITSDVKVVNANGFTVTTGNIKNNDSIQHDISIQVNFYNDKKRIAGSANTLISGIAAGETKPFTMTTMGDLTKNTSEVKVEFIK